jgi:hypothetical protein
MARRDKRVPRASIKSHPTGGPDGTAQAKRLRIRFPHVWLAIFVFALLFGYQRGKANRPVYKDTDFSGNLANYVVAHANVEIPEWEEDRIAGGIGQFFCGVDPVRWDIRTSVVVTDNEYEQRVRDRVHRHVERIRAHSVVPNLGESSLWTTYSANVGDIYSQEINELGTPREGTSVTDIIELVAGGAGAYTATHTAEEAAKYWRTIRRAPVLKRFAGGAILLVTGAIGFRVGYGWAYEDKPDCSSEEVRYLLDRPGFWKQVSKKLVSKYHLERNKKGLITKIGSESGDSLSLADAWMISHSQILWAQEEGEKPRDFRLSDAAEEDLALNSAMRHPWEFVPGWQLVAEHINDHLYQSEKPSRLRLELTRALLESQLWSKENDGSWRAEIWLFDDRLTQECFRNDGEHDEGPFVWETFRMMRGLQVSRSPRLGGLL